MHSSCHQGNCCWQKTHLGKQKWGLSTQKGREQRQDHQNVLRDSTVLVGRIVMPLLATQMLPSNLSPLPDISPSTITTTPATPQSLQLLPVRKINHWIETSKRIEMKENLLVLEDCSSLTFKNTSLPMESNLSRRDLFQQCCLLILLKGIKENLSNCHWLFYKLIIICK